MGVATQQNNAETFSAKVSIPQLQEPLVRYRFGLHHHPFRIAQWASRSTPILNTVPVIIVPTLPECNRATDAGCLRVWARDRLLPQFPFRFSVPVGDDGVGPVD